MTYAFAVVGTAVLGFAAGLVLFKVKSRWCPQCGSKLTCRTCIGGQGNRVRVES